MIRTATRLGIIACRYLVQGYEENRYISAPEIAEHYNMNVRALMPALRQFTRAGILRSRTGGKEPGFIFAHNPQEITILDILTALEGHNEVLCCKEINLDLKCDCNSKTDCFIYTTLRDLIQQSKIKLAAINVGDYSKS